MPKDDFDFESQPATLDDLDSKLMDIELQLADINSTLEEILNELKKNSSSKIQGTQPYGAGVYIFTGIAVAVIGMTILYFVFKFFEQVF